MHDVSTHAARHQSGSDRADSFLSEVWQHGDDRSAARMGRGRRRHARSSTSFSSGSRQPAAGNQNSTYTNRRQPGRKTTTQTAGQRSTANRCQRHGHTATKAAVKNYACESSRRCRCSAATGACRCCYTRAVRQAVGIAGRKFGSDRQSANRSFAKRKIFTLERSSGRHRSRRRDDGGRYSLAAGGQHDLRSTQRFSARSRNARSCSAPLAEVVLARRGGRPGGWAVGFVVALVAAKRRQRRDSARQCRGLESNRRIAERRNREQCFDSISRRRESPIGETIRDNNG